MADTREEGSEPTGAEVAASRGMRLAAVCLFVSGAGSLILEMVWSRLTRLPMYSPRFLTGYRNPPVRSTTFHNVYFAGNYRTFPSISTTGTALGSGIDAGEAILADHGQAAEPAASASRSRR